MPNLERAGDKPTERQSGRAHSPSGHSLYFELSGPVDAPPLLLIRGLARSSAYWLEFRELLEREHRLLTMDNRGSGQSDCPSPPWRVEDMADDAALVLAESGIGRANVYGISLGGMIAQQLALRHPSQVDRLILVSTTVGRARGVKTPPRAVFEMVRCARMETGPAMAASAPLALSPEFLARRPDVVNLWTAIASRERRHPGGIWGQLLAAAGHNTSHLLRYLQHRTLLITGDRDQLIPSENTDILAAMIADCRVLVFEGAGHDLPTERPQESCEAVASFLREGR